MRSTQKSFLDAMRKNVLALNRLLEQAEGAYQSEANTHNRLTQVRQNYHVDPDDREGFFLSSRELEGAENDWLLAVLFKEEARNIMVATGNELKDQAVEAVAMIASAVEADEDFVIQAKTLVVLASAGLFRAKTRNGILQDTSRPRIDVSEVVAKRFPRADHEVRVVHARDGV